MTICVDAVYENGVFRPLKPVELAQGQRVELEVVQNVVSDEEVQRLLAQAFKVYEGLTEEEIHAIESAFRRKGPCELPSERAE